MTLVDNADSTELTLGPPLTVSGGPDDDVVPVPAAVRDGGRSARTGRVRVVMHLVLASLPLLAISAHVFGLIDMHRSAGFLVLPFAVLVAVLAGLAPHGTDRVLGLGVLWGMLACAIYDAFRLDTVYMLGWWGDFIPSMGTWILGDPSDRPAGAVVGYLWRYIGDGGGIGTVFFALAALVGAHRWRPQAVVGAAVAFAVMPVWSGLIATVALAPRGQRLMFPLTPTTIVLSLVGHLIFGVILGVGFWRSRAVMRHWPWVPVRLGRFVRSAGPVVPSPRVAPVDV
jgi:hypothetical protein